MQGLKPEKNGETMNLRRLAVSTAKAGRLTLVGLILGFMGLSSCDARYTDVSDKPMHAERVGQQCVVLKGLRAHGFTLDLSKKDKTHAVTVTTLPGIGGPEITFKTPIPKGTTFVVTSVRECWNCPFDRIDYGVEIRDFPELSAYKVFAYSEVLGPQEAQCMN